MKKTAKILISIMLIVSVALSIASCEAVGYILSRFDRTNSRGPRDWYEGCPVPEGYTGGISGDYRFHESYEIKWLETYEEMVDAVTRLRAHGTEIHPIALFDCEDYGFDLKFCIVFKRPKEQLSEGQGYFDRKLDGVEISTYVFFENITIEDLEYYDVCVLKCAQIYNYQYSRFFATHESTEAISIEKLGQENTLENRYAVRDNDSTLFVFYTYCYLILTEDQIEILEKTLVVIT